MEKIAILGSGITGKAVEKKVGELGGFEVVQTEFADLIIASPGIPPKDYPKVDVEVISEIEFAYRLMTSGLYGVPPKIVAISGTNGKTTTTTLTGLVLDCPVAGNIGEPLINFVGEKHEYIVCEVSSYQLESSPTFKPYISVLLNLTEDHLERHGSMENYLSAKVVMVKNQDLNDYFIYNRDDSWISKIVDGVSSKLIGFSSDTALGQNYVAVRKIAAVCNIESSVVETVFSNFRGVEHRLENVGIFGGVSVINDSKGTNPDSTIVALESLEAPIVLIVGGKDKNVSLNGLADLLHEKVKRIVLLGEASTRFTNEFIGFGYKQENIQRVDTMQEAVESAFFETESGDTILLSPACASFDMYKNFEERGVDFKHCVQQYTSGHNLI